MAGSSVGLGGACLQRSRRLTHIPTVMRGLDPRIHDFKARYRNQQRRGCPDQVRAWRKWRWRAKSLRVGSTWFQTFS